MNVEMIKNELRDGKSESLSRRRKIVSLSLLGLIDFGIISLYQTGIIRSLPDFPGKVFNSNKVNASTDAYQMGAPDGPISATVYGLNMILASALGSKKSGRKSIFDVLLGGTILANAAGGAYYLYNMITKQKVVCPYCVSGALINFAMIPFAFPDTVNGVRKIITGKKTMQDRKAIQARRTRKVKFTAEDLIKLEQMGVF